MRISSIAAIAVVVIFSTPLSAAISYSGLFTRDDQREIFSLTVAAPGNTVFQTFGYAGGTNGNGSLIAPGGFDPVLSLFDSTGTLIGFNNDDPSAPVDPITGVGLDAYLLLFLPAGDYTLVLTQSDNFPVGPDLAAGFTRTGEGDFTGPAFIGSPGSFWDFTPAQRNGSWALDIDGAAIAAIPEPGTLQTLSLGLVGILLFLRRRSVAQQKC